MVIPALALLAGIASCDPCHKPVVDSYRKTAHAHSSARADAESILGSFSPDRNTLITANPALRFQMDWRRDGFYQTAFDHGKSRSERLDIVMGSGRRGQTYIFRANQKLFQLPVSFSRAGSLMGGRGVSAPCPAPATISST